MTKIFGHRGAAGNYPENTLLSFEKALEFGVDGLELDVHYSKDGHLVVFHDFFMKDSNEKVSDKTLAELKKILIVNGDYSDTIPALEDVLQLIVTHQNKSHKKILLNVEWKAGSVFYPDIEENSYALCTRYLDPDQLIFSSFDHYAIQKIKAIRPEAKTGLLTQSALADPWIYMDYLKADFYHPHYMIATKNELEKLKAHQIKSNIYTVNDPKLAARLIEEGVHGIFTDFPESICSLIL